jgi:hypothetical protein
VNSAPDIALNFLPLASSNFFYTIYRKQLDDTQPSVPGTRHLPQDCSESNVISERHRYEVALQQREGFESVQISAWIDQGLTDEVLYSALVARASSAALQTQTELSDRQFVREVAFVLARHEDAREVMRLRAYALRAVGRFGFLCNFGLRVPNTSLIPDRRRLELSLTHKHGRINEDYYLDQNQKIGTFLALFFGQLAKLTLHDGSTVDIEPTLSVVKSFTLLQRNYVFGHDHEAKNQFFGLREHGPYQKAASNNRLVFMFTGEDRERSQHLFRALRGDIYSTFPGMDSMFGSAIGRDNVSGLEVSGFSNDEVQKSCLTLKSQFPDTHVVPVALVPFSKHTSDEDTRDYFAAKHAFIANGYASQFIDRKRLQDRNSLKWSISNIGLAIFAKMRGVPWRVKPSTTRCLIVGVGQAHRIVDRKVEKFVAYSVLTDSTGRYETITVLGESDNEEDYISALKERLRGVLVSHKDQYDSFVLHVTFSMRRKEVEAIQAMLAELKGAEGRQNEFVAIKFNDKNDFFGFSVAHNSRVPNEGTVVRLSKRDYLMWFSGLSLEDSKAPKKPEKPVHLKILYPEDGLPEVDLRRVCQDAFNIAGTNLRGFNAKSIPISVYYAKLIADYYGHFREADLPEINLENVAPWFL